MPRRACPALGLGLISTLAATAGACGDATLRPHEMKVPCTTNTVVGYAAVGGDADGGVAGPTSGGNDSPEPPIRVSRVEDLVRELQSTVPRVIFLDGMVAPAEPIKVTLDKDARNGNKTLIGVGANSGLTGAGLDLSYADNVIVRNLKITKANVGEGDAITLLASNHIWIDHCDLSSDRNDTVAGYDGLVDITHGSAHITVSWTRFHDHKDTSLVGHSADVAQMTEDAALSVTFHHNLFSNVSSGPRIRFGKAHVFSNHFQNVTLFGVAAESFAWVQVDHNVFENVGTSITTSYQDPNPGTMTEMTNKFPAGFVPDIMRPAGPTPQLPYSFTPDESVTTVVSACAGTDKITFE